MRGVSKLMEIVLLLKEELGHEAKARALITMYDYRTRYSRHVLEKVRESFGHNVFDTAIRYNIRLRETVDYGMPIGEYDKHSIGHKDYEKLTDEMIGGWRASTAQGFEALDGARTFRDRSETYTASVAAPPEDRQESEHQQEILQTAQAS